MTRFRVPERHVSALRFLALADEGVFERLQAALAVEPATSRAELEDRIRGLLPAGEDVPPAVALAGAILSACVVRSSERADAARFASDLASADDLGFSDEQRGLFESRLVGILGLEALTNLAKAADLLSESERPFAEGRVITDIRPVFSDNATEAPVGAVIVHTLKVDFYDRDGFASTYFAMDDADLKQVGEAVERALEKSESLRKLLSSAGLAAMAPLREGDEPGED